MLEISSLSFISMIVELEDYYNVELGDGQLDFSVYDTRKNMKEINAIIAKRKSSRNFIEKSVDINDVYLLLESARWAPSGKNGQPWRFIVVKEKGIKLKIANCSIYKKKKKNADTFIVVYLDKDKSYNYIKDVQGIGAAIENICIQATAMDLGTCWIGEILSNEHEVNCILNVPSNFELMAVICVGYTESVFEHSQRLPLDELIHKVYQ